MQETPNACNTTLSVEKEQFRTEAKQKLDKAQDARQELQKEYTERVKSIASALGVPNTVGHIKQRIAELDDNLEKAEDALDRFKASSGRNASKLSTLETERDELKKKAESRGQQRDTFKKKFEEKASALEISEGKIRFLLDRGLWDRKASMRCPGLFFETNRRGGIREWDNYTREYETPFGKMTHRNKARSNRPIWYSSWYSVYGMIDYPTRTITGNRVWITLLRICNSRKGYLLKEVNPLRKIEGDIPSPVCNPTYFGHGHVIE